MSGSDGVNWGDKKQVLERVKVDGLLVRKASVDLLSDQDVVFAAIMQNGYALCYLSDKLRADRVVVTEAVKSNSAALFYASCAIKDDFEVVLEAVRENVVSVQHASKRIIELCDGRNPVEALTEAIMVEMALKKKVAIDSVLSMEGVKSNGKVKKT